MDQIRGIIFHQNKDFLQQIANDMFVCDKDKQVFMDKYHKKHFSFFQIKKQDKTDSYQKTIQRCVKMT